MTTASANGPEVGADALSVLGWDTAWAAAFDGMAGVPARVERVDRGAIRALTADGPIATAAPIDSALVTGDWVALDGDAVTRLRRRTALVRRDPAAEPAPQTLAANMHEVWIVHAAQRPPRAAWIDRALVIAYGSGATPIIVLTKTDLASDSADVTAASRALSPHTAIMATSAVTGEGIDALDARLRGGHCAALLGRSGAGKSSLVNALVGAASQTTGQVREGDARGRHTTTRRAMVLAAGGTVIDTPGIRALGLWQPEVGLRGAFPGIAELAERCRFNDCTHRHEPGCAVLDARRNGQLAADRYDRYIALGSN